MDRDNVKKMLLQALTDVAPEIEPGAIEPGKPLRAQVDLDSADWLNFLVAVHEKLGVDIPDAAAAKLNTLDKLIEYCASRP